MNQAKLDNLEKLIDRDYGNIAGMVILSDSKTVYERYFNECTATSRIHLFSVTKSIVSMLIVIAVDRSCIRSLDQRVLDYFPEYEVRKCEKTIQSITLRDLLTMTAPYKFKYNPYTKYFTSADWVRFSLDLLGGTGQVGKFRYAPLIGPDILSGILVKATGQSVFDFANQNLFAPLGISVEQCITFDTKEEQLEFYKATNISGWVADPNGTNAAGWGLTLSPADMAKLGQLYLDGGEWDGQQIISASWIADSTTEHSRWEKPNLPYGYLWWVVKGGFAATGDGGNTIYVNTHKRLVIAIASLFVTRAKDRIELIERYIEPIFES